MRKTLTVFVLTIVLGIMLAACSTGNGGNEVVEPDLTTNQMVEEMVADIEQPAFMELETEDINVFYGINVDKLEEFTVRIPMMNVHTNEIAIFKVKNDGDIAEVEDLAKERAEVVQKQFESYLQDQYENAKDYRLVTKGNYVLFVISEDADKLTDVFETFFEKD